MLAYAVAREAVDIVNRLSDDPRLTCDTRIPGHSRTEASNGSVMGPDRTDWDGAEDVDLALIFCGDDLPKRIPNGFQNFLAQVDAAGGRLGGVAGGTTILGRIGRLDGCRAVLHRAPESDETFPAVEILDRPYLLDNRRLTVAGGLAIADALCAWIAEQTSPALADEVSRGLMSGRVQHRQTSAPTEPEDSPDDPVIAEMEAQMRAHLADPLPLSDLAESMGLSRKALRGRCMRALGVTPSDHYLAIRLRHGAELLRHTAMPVSEIARASGFETLAGFSRSIRNTLGVSPSAMRKMARAARLVQKYA
ncbi:GlxA family transcriptional regulator [Roseicyclus marinus]|uniref:GlxA family transcriptional regulator n=1 Tax=Roseicyclus marinus TaxID=2161673 RepID=UPI00240F3F75|nr:helix-turn-helix domain-containing protein [Roseicyclus marinus]MDG3040375.1 helix-turn-helix domain-containing protein [Roseicyclus marinus]